MPARLSPGTAHACDGRNDGARASRAEVIFAGDFRNPLGASADRPPRRRPRTPRRGPSTREPAPASADTGAVTKKAPEVNDGNGTHHPNADDAQDPPSA